MSRDRTGATRSLVWTIASSGTLVVLGALVAVGLVTVGRPGAGRGPSADARRVADLRRLSALVDGFFTRQHLLPASLDQLARESRAAPLPQDPVTAQAYEYRPEGALAYSLCATFDGERPDEPRDAWWHDAGRHCFSLEIRDRK
jgi:hypothetical protein